MKKTILNCLDCLGTVEINQYEWDEDYEIYNCPFCGSEEIELEENTNE